VPSYHTLLHSLAHSHAAWIASAASVALYIAVMLAIPVVLARLPADYFVRPHVPRHPIVSAIRAGVGSVVLIAGVAMLFLPGPGILGILLGLAIMGGPLAERGMRHMLCRPRILGAINAIREKRGRPPLLRPPCAPRDPA
jgi:hypothetical protein